MFKQTRVTFCLGNGNIQGKHSGSVYFMALIGGNIMSTSQQRPPFSIDICWFCICFCSLNLEHKFYFYLFYKHWTEMVHP